MIAGVLFDFHNTLVRKDSLSGWLSRAWETAGRPEEHVGEIIPVLRSVWSRASARYPDGDWDLDSELHRHVFEEILVQESPCPAAVASALYEAIPSRWTTVHGAIPLLESLVSQRIRLGIVSNIALDIRPRLEELGMLHFFDTIVLSYEVGVVKPDARIFERALANLDLHPSQCLMVGDTPSTDGGAVNAGICSILVPTVDDRPQLDVPVALLAGISR